MGLVTVRRSGFVSPPALVEFSTSNGTATGGETCTSGIDFINVNQQVYFNQGETSKTIPIILCPDLITEPTQTINLTLTGIYVVPPSRAVMNINDTASQYKNAANIAINGGGAAAPYPSTITVTGGPVSFGSMRVTLFDLSSSFPANADFLLISPNGIKFILLSGAGGLTPGGPATLTFSDLAGQVVPDNGPLSAGSFEPTSWLPTVSNFPAPAPPNPYNLPGSAVGGTGTQTLAGNFGVTTDSNGVWSLYVRDRSLIPLSPETVIGSVDDGWGLEFTSTEAASASISGRVTTTDGRGIRNAKVTITGNSLEHPLVATTGSFGYYTFDGLATLQTYVVTVSSRRYSFSTPSRVISLIDNIADADFIADPQ